MTKSHKIQKKMQKIGSISENWYFLACIAALAIVLDLIRHS